MIYGYARVSTDGQSVDAQVKQLRATGAAKVFRETASGAKTERAELAKALRALDDGDTLLVTRLDRLARSTRDLLNTLAQIADKGVGFHSLTDAWADTTTAHARLMLTVTGGLAELERDLMCARAKFVSGQPLSAKRQNSVLAIWSGAVRCPALSGGAHTGLNRNV